MLHCDIALQHTQSKFPVSPDGRKIEARPPSSGCKARKRVLRNPTSPRR